MNFTGKRVLVLEGYARQCLPLMRSFKQQECEVTLLCNTKLDLGYVSRLPDHKILGICDPHKYDESEEYICRLIESGNYDLVVPLVDFSASILSKNKERLSRYAQIFSNEWSVFDKAQDKLFVMQTCMEKDIPSPKTLTDIVSVDEVIDSDLQYPIVVKPRRGCGGKGFHCFQTKEEFLNAAENLTLKDSVIQEYIPQTDQNLSASLFIDCNGVVKSAFVYRSTRWYPLQGGTGTFNQLVDREDAIRTASKLASELQLRGWIGVDFIHDPRDGIAKVIEVNPRILACAKIGFDAGIDMGVMILQHSFGKEVKEQVVSKKNVNVRMSQTDILWLLKSPNRFKAKPSWFSCRNTKDQTFSWRDPLPWFAFLLRGMINYNKEMEERR